MNGPGSPLDAALSNPWATIRFVFGEPLHPGGEAATDALLDRADVSGATRLLDVGCGGGGALSLARARGAAAVGVDRRPAEDRAGVLRGDMTRLPVRNDSVDVVLAECVLCLSSDFSCALSEAGRVLRGDGRLALSDVVVDGSPPELPDSIAEALCLTGPRGREELVESVERAGFDVGTVRDHRKDLLAMRDRAADRVDYEGLLGAIGDRGSEVLSGIRELEAAVEAGRIGYISLVARRR